MGGGSSKKKRNEYMSSEQRVVAILGVQGVGKSTVMKQFRDGEGEFLLSAEKTEGVKRDILKAVALRVRVLLIHISTDVGTESVASVDDALDDLQEAESAYLASVATLSTEEIKTLKDHDLSPDAPALTANVSARECTCNEEATKLLQIIGQIWKVDTFNVLNSDEKATFKLSESLQSSEKEQLFQAGAFFISRVSEITSNDYVLTRSDYLHSRSWTEGVNETSIKVLDETVTLRDVGGDELNRATHWGKAIKDSFCNVFVIALPDYTKLDSATKASKFRRIRKLLWTYIISKERPKFLILLNKQDLFHKNLKEFPLHKSKEFSDAKPQADGESHDAYARRCEETICTFFNTMPTSVRKSEEYIAAKGEIDFDKSKLKINATFVTQATDVALFRKVKGEFLQAFGEILQAQLKNYGFC